MIETLLTALLAFGIDCQSPEWTCTAVESGSLIYVTACQTKGYKERHYKWPWPDRIIHKDGKEIHLEFRLSRCPEPT